MKNDRKHPSALEVWLNQTRVGTITNLPSDRNLFVFDDEYVSNKGRPVLSLGFYHADGELITAPQEVQTKVPPFFSNLLPEGRMREYLAERGGVKEAREFPLLWLLGTDLSGAVWVQDSEGRPLPPTDAAEVGERSSRSNVRAEGPLRFSLAGVQLKFSAVGQPKQLSIPVEGRGGYWIVKLPSPRYPLVPENEYSMMTLAKRIGINVAEVGLVPVDEIDGMPPEFANDESNALYVRRFDRTEDGKKIHIEDFNQLYGQFPDVKYKNFSYGNMAGDIWRVMGEQDLLEFIRRLVFNAAIGNQDMHLKNWSLIYADGRTPRLSPGYDFVSTIRYIADPKMALSIAREKDTKFLDTDLLESFAARARVPSRPVLDVALETAERTVNAWSEMNADLPLDSGMRQRINDQLKYVPLTGQFLQESGGRKPRASARQRGRRAAKRTSSF